MEQFKTLEDLREYVKEIGSLYARPTTRGEHPTLYIDQKGEDYIQGVRKRDYLFSTCGNWVLPTKSMGLSFSAHWQHLKNIYRLKSTRNGGQPVDVCWVFNDADLPDGLEFVVDEKDKKGRHYFLAVSKRMRVSELVAKLEWVADRMSVIKEANKVL